MITASAQQLPEAGLRLLARCLALGAAGGSAAGAVGGAALVVVAGGSPSELAFFLVWGAMVGLVVGVLVQAVTAMLLNSLRSSASTGGLRSAYAVAALVPVLGALTMVALLLRAVEVSRPEAPVVLIAATVVTAVVACSTARWCVGR